MMFTVMLSRTFAFVIFLAFGCTTEVTALNIRRPGYDCEGKVANGTVLHDVGSSKYNCCYPVNCSGGDIKFCSEDLGRDKCIPCAGPRCNYKNISSQYVVKRDVEFCIEKCIYGTPVVEFDPPEQTRHRGDNVTITTIVKADNLVEHFYWSKDGTEIALNNNTSDTNKYTVETSQYKISLTIIDLHWSDTGIYSLVVTDSAGTSSNGSIKVNVVSRPLVNMKIHDQADAGSTYDVLCRVDGDSFTTSMTFKHRSEKTRQLNASLHDGGIKYTIRNISSKDVGYYSCIAENSECKDETSMYLSVHSKPEIKFLDDNRTFTFDAGDKMSIYFLVTYQHKPKEPICRRHNSNMTLPLKEILNVGIWMIFGVVITNIQPRDGGNFTCEATNRLGTTLSELYIIVKPNETVRTDPQQVVAICSALYIAVIVICSIHICLICGCAVCSTRLLQCITCPVIIFIGIIISILVLSIISIVLSAVCDKEGIVWIIPVIIPVIIIILDIAVLILFCRLRASATSARSNTGRSRLNHLLESICRAVCGNNREDNTTTTHEGSPDHSHNDEAVSSDSICKTLDFIMDEETNKEASSSSSDGAEEEPLLNHSQNDKPGNDLEEDITELTTFDTAGNHTKETSV